MKTRCYSVRLKELREISPKALLATAFDGSTAVIPKSQIFGPDQDILKSEAYWISAWILERNSLQYSSKKEGWFCSDTREQLPTFTFTKHVPEKITKDVEPNKDLLR